MRAENIENLYPDKNFVTEEMKKDRLTLAEHLLKMGNLEEAKRCYIGVGMSLKQADEMIKDWLGRGKNTVH